MFALGGGWMDSGQRYEIRMNGPVNRRRWLRGSAFMAFAVMVGLLWLEATGRVAWPRSAVFQSILVAVLVLNLAWWLRSDLRLVQVGGRPVVRRWSRLVLAAYMILMLAPAFGMLRGSLDWRLLPTPLVMWVQLWHMLIVLAVPIGAISGVCIWAVASIRGRRSGRPSVSDEVDVSRRAFLHCAAVAAPVFVAGGGAAAGMWQVGRLAIRRYAVSPPGLPDRLRGLTITHLSDFHIGRLYQMGHFRRAVDAANRLDSDIVVITGDLVDHSNQVLPEALDTLRGLRHRYGLFACLGNHDLIDDGDLFVACLRREGVPLLVNERREIDIGGERLRIGGLMWSRRDTGTPQRPGHEQCAEATFGPRSPDSVEPFTIALAHHPHAFDATAGRRIPLTLTGHTHGGQLMLTPPGWPDIGAGNMLFRYIRGFYTGDGATGTARALSDEEDACVRSGQPILFVNAGAGNWFPVRINAPAEIVQLRLV